MQGRVPGAAPEGQLVPTDPGRVEGAPTSRSPPPRRSGEPPDMRSRTLHHDRRPRGRGPRGPAALHGTRERRGRASAAPARRRDRRQRPPRTPALRQRRRPRRSAAPPPPAAPSATGSSAGRARSPLPPRPGRSAPGARTTFAIRVQPARTVRSYRLKLWKAPRGVTAAPEQDAHPPQGDADRAHRRLHPHRALHAAHQRLAAPAPRRPAQAEGAPRQADARRRRPRGGRPAGRRRPARQALRRRRRRRAARTRRLAPGEPRPHERLRHGGRRDRRSRSRSRA